MKRKITLIALMIIFSLKTFSQAPAIQWQKCFGGALNEFAYSIIQTVDQGYAIAGISNSYDGDVTGSPGMLYDCWILKIDGSGNIQWQKCLGGSASDSAMSIIQTSDGGFVVVGVTTSNDGDVSGNHGGKDCWIVKLSSSGGMLWQRCFGGTNDDQGYSIVQTVDGNIVFAGRTNSNDGDVSGNHGIYDFWVVKLDMSGNIIWQKCYGGSNWDYASSIIQASDSGYAVVGSTASNDGNVTGYHGFYDYWMVKLDSVGIIQWQKCYGGSYFDHAYSIIQSESGGYVIAGYSMGNDGDVSGLHGAYDYWILKIDSVGAIKWQKCFGGTSYDLAHSIVQTSAGGYVVAGYSRSIEGDVICNHADTTLAIITEDYWIVKLDTTGNIEWTKCLGGRGQEYARSIVQATDGGFAIVGDATWFNDGDVGSGHNGATDFWIVKLSSEVGIEEEDFNSSFIIYPNPVSNNITIELFSAQSEKKELSIYNTLGQEVLKKNFSSQKQSINVSAFARGVYFVEVRREKGAVRKKIIKI